MPSERPRILAVLTSYDDRGDNSGQLAIYADGATKPFGDHSFLRAALRILRGHALSPFLKSCTAHPSSPISIRKRRKASSSAPGQTADAAE